MSDYDFIVDNIRFSYSSMSGFDNCNYAFKLTYIESMPRKNNFYGEYGTLIHECLEKYFKGELEAFELSDYYKNNYDSIVVDPPPPSKNDLNKAYREDGLNFFDNFSFDRDSYEVLLIEDMIEFVMDDTKFVAKPDLVLRHKQTGEYILYDYKTAMPFRIDKNGKETEDKQKLEGYYKQTHIYSYALRNYRNIPISEIRLLFTRARREMFVPCLIKKEEETVEWMKSIVRRIKNEEIFAYNNTNSYFCNNLCSVRTFCEYR